MEKIVKLYMNKNFKIIDGITVIIPESYTPSPKDCEICGLAFRHQEDYAEHERYGCCIDCSLHFMQPNRKKWKNGWRPSKEEVQRVIFNKTTGENHDKDATY